MSDRRGGEPRESSRIERLTSVPLREVWAHALDFTVWLAENVDLVGDAIGLTLGDVRREVAAGTFSVDLAALESTLRRSRG